MTNNLLAPATSAIPQVLVSQFLANTETTQYAATAVVVKLASATLTNTSGSSVNVSLSLVKSGGTAGSSNRVLSVYPLAAGDSLVVKELADHVLGAGDFVSALAGTASAVAFALSGIVFS